MADDNHPEQYQDPMPAAEHRMEPKPDFEPRHPGTGKLKDKVALITGGDSGIGRATAVLFAREGAKVAIAYLDEDTDAEETQRLVEREGSEALLLRGDLGDKSTATDTVKRTVDHFGQLDVLIINAAQQYLDQGLEDLSEDTLRRTMDSNVMAPIFVTQAALPHLKPGASVVYTSSVNAFKGNDSLVAYSTSRGATLALARSMANALTPKGIRVNSVAPGPIWTPFIPGTMETSVDEFGAGTPMGRCGQPWEVATCFLFLASDDGNYLSGQTLHPNGGVVVAA
ncbi:SDR family oxidoreductase [Histidinibacterium aquaticum]|uniref:SDR family oxidoreductase n=1 Tax=Histidinibacterium aquaticum TaxID=2613962 RepID=A0A5J5GGS7_9RHOB|nr:SDR family oxidoreductase [Histidinibacterium aquaticum]KAA9006943.1 SDR family oxidoreductase [Histidinibacterium aquaticum]